MQALLAKFHEGRPPPDDSAAPFDAPSVLALWLYASEHWQQARQPEPEPEPEPVPEPYQELL